MSAQKFKKNQLVVAHDGPYALLHRVVESHPSHVVLRSVDKASRRSVYFYADGGTLQLATDEQVNNFTENLQELINLTKSELETLVATLWVVRNLCSNTEEDNNEVNL